jgi:hypothetical protein
VVTLRWQLRTAYHHGELGLVKHCLAPKFGRGIDARGPRGLAPVDAAPELPIVSGPISRGIKGRLLVRQPTTAANFNGTLVEYVASS